MWKIMSVLMLGIWFASPIYAEQKQAPPVTQNVSNSQVLKVYRSASCGCCKGWVSHMRDNGFSIQEEVIDNVEPIKDQMKIPNELRACHTATIGGYTIEGHVPAADVQKLLKDKPDIQGIAAPGMPAGSPGMDYGNRKEPYNVVSFDPKGNVKIFKKHP